MIGDAEGARVLADCLDSDKTKCSELRSAILSNNLFKVKELLKDKTVNINEKDSEGLSPIHYAVCLRYADIFRLLIKHRDTNLNATDNRGWTPLHYAVKHNNYEFVRTLLKKRSIKKGEMLRISLFNSEENGMTPLHMACFFGLYEIAELLVYKKAPINKQDINGNSPLMRAVMSRNHKTINLLASQPKTNFSIRNNKGQTVFDLPQVIYYREIHDLLSKYRSKI